MSRERETYNQGADEICNFVATQVDIILFACKLCQIERKLLFEHGAFREIGLLKRTWRLICRRGRGRGAMASQSPVMRALIADCLYTRTVRIHRVSTKQSSARLMTRRRNQTRTRVVDGEHLRFDLVDEIQNYALCRQFVHHRRVFVLVELRV